MAYKDAARADLSEEYVVIARLFPLSVADFGRVSDSFVETQRLEQSPVVPAEMPTQVATLELHVMAPDAAAAGGYVLNGVRAALHDSDVVVEQISCEAWPQMVDAEVDA